MATTPDSEEVIRLDPENQLHLDQALIRVPFELQRKYLKSAQRAVEKDSSFTTETLQATAVKAAEGQSAEETIKSMDRLIARAEALQQKLQNLATEEKRQYEHGDRRTQHIQDLYDAPGLTSDEYTAWSKMRLQRMIVDYLLRSGYPETAQELAKAKGIEPLVDIDPFLRCNQIRDSLLRKSTAECLSWCQENKLKKREHDLEFELRVQQYVELIKGRTAAKMREAQQHAAQYLYPQVADGTDHWQKLIASGGLLSFAPSTIAEPARTLYSPDRWRYLADLFVQTHHSLFGLPIKPALHLALTAGLSAIKTPMCHPLPRAYLEKTTELGGMDPTAPTNGAKEELRRMTTSHMGSSSAVICPVCSPELNSLAKDVPYANHTISKNMEAESVVLPNGRVYGLERLMAMGRKGGTGPQQIRDPVTGEVFGVGEWQTVFIS